MKIYLASDHAGFTIKEYVKQFLERFAYKVDDYGTFSYDSVDYPDFSHAVAKKVSEDFDSIGILICGSGNGICMTANKHKNIRAALCWNVEIAKMAKAHNNANILCMPGRYISVLEAESIVLAYLNTEFEGNRHQLRINKIENE
jgi:ribose 5-phosphate isomerase B